LLPATGTVKVIKPVYGDRGSSPAHPPDRIQTGLRFLVDGRIYGPDDAGEYKGRKMKTVKVRLDIEIDTDQAVEVRHILAARGIREILLTELRYKFMAIEMAAGSRTGAIQVKLLVADEAASGDPGGTGVENTAGLFSENYYVLTPQPG
jgi:hypothetical protein